MIPNQWYAILPSKSVKMNQIVGVKRLNLELALFRNNKGEIGCVVDQCTHRGAVLSKGKVEGDCIQVLSTDWSLTRQAAAPSFRQMAKYLLPTSVTIMSSTIPFEKAMILFTSGTVSRKES